MGDWIVIGVVAGIIGLALRSIHQQKKSGAACAGCAQGKACASTQHH
jgi:hypothetical protein